MEITVKNRFIPFIMECKMTSIIIEDLPVYDEYIVLKSEDNIILLKTLCRSVSTVKIDPKYKRVFMLLNNTWYNFVDPAFEFLIQHTGFFNKADFFNFYNKPMVGHLLEFGIEYYEINPDL